MHVIPLSEPDLSDREEEAVSSVVRSGWISSAGPDIPDFEQDLAQYCERAEAIATASGTSAIQLVLDGLGIGAGDQVIVPSFCFAATANAVIHAGAAPVFVDADRLSWTLDIGLVEQALSNCPSVRAILAVDVLGNFPDFRALLPLANQLEIPVIEDAAGALGAFSSSGPGGSHGYASILSFNGNKVISTGAGGMVLCDDIFFADKLRHLCAQARTGKEYVHDQVGNNYRMANLNAALGRAQFSRLNEMLEKRHQISDRYQRLASSSRCFSFQPQQIGGKGNGWLPSFIFEAEALAEDFITYLAEAKIMTRRFWQPLHIQKPYEGYEAYLSGVAEDIAGRIVSLPASSNLPDADLERILHTIQSWCEIQDER
ncbi:MAG: aminotransferase class I/II-fold pyridoxal phosphate-dependent enzyme [Alphaproteobacteria bacterium]|nr:aminotransferase class I/II-fold pyridoxal phosphate-dependent enzyme [Alphaproteobacteria bacterium]